VNGRILLPGVVAMLFGATAPIVLAQDPAAASSAPSKPAPPARAVRALPDVIPAGLDLFVSHRRSEGRLVVKVGTQAVLSAPFSAIKPGANGWFERPLSVESGHQTVTVMVIDGAGRLVAQQATEANLAATGTATLAVADHGGTGKGLTLEWRTP
jgi:hypothetical protein